MQKTKRAAAPAEAAGVSRQAYEEEPSVEERAALAAIAPPTEEAPAAEESIAREVVHEVMEGVKRSVIERAAEAEQGVEEEEAVVTPSPEAPPEAPAAAAPSTEAPPSPPSPAPEPPPESAQDASPAPAQTQEEANRELDREVAEALGTHPESETGPESGPATSSEESFVIA